MNWRETIDKDGFAVIPAMFTTAKMDRLLTDVNQAAPTRSRAGIRHAMALAPVGAIALELVELVRDILGRQAFPFRATLFDKSPQSNWLVVWHQDTALPLRHRREARGWGPGSVKEGFNYAHAPATALSEVLALRVHLDDSTAANGPLRVLPCTHTLGVLTDDGIHELSTRIAPVDCLVPKGGLVMMRPLLVHASSKSQSAAAPRRILHIEYASSPVIAEPLDLAVA